MSLLTPACNLAPMCNTPAHQGGIMFRGMTFGPDDKTAAEILRDPNRSQSDAEAVARYIDLLEGLLPKAISHRRDRFNLEASVSREEAEIVRALSWKAELDDD